MTGFPHPLIVADIGGTNCRLGLIDAPGGAAKPLGRIDSQGEGELHDAIADFVTREGVKARGALLAVAGPVTGVRMAITNAGRMLDGPALGKRLGLGAVMIVNDFEAQAAALTTLKLADLVTLRAGDAEANGARLAVGPGTGFGVGTLVDDGAGRLVVPSEGGHIGFGPETPDEARIWPHLEGIDGHITVESVLSGAGLARLVRAFAQADGAAAPELDAVAITARALSGEDARCRAAVLMFLDLLARAAGDIALVAKATGGVFIAGGITPRLLPLLDAGRFAARFSERPPMSFMLSRMPIHVITAENPGFSGLGALANAAARVRMPRPAIWTAGS
ncbi:glucokinase [Terrarubrum flagellatum]|uniref:glucokinase n=1 Tax=Terrirubrum flagellatum TaxID=2895980 RepID=UPI00314529CC